MDVRTAPTFDAARFFEVLLPAWLRSKTDALRSVSGVLQFHLVTGAGQKSWFLTPEPDSVHEGEHDTPDVTITLDEPVVLPMLLGDLDFDGALERGEVHVDGSPRVLDGWVRIFAGERSVLDLMGRAEP